VHAARFSQLLSARLFLQHLRCRSSWIIRETDEQLIPASREICLTIRWLWGLSSWLSNSDSTVPTFSLVCALRLPLPERLSTVPNFTSSLFVDAVFRPTFVQNFVMNCRAFQPIHSYWFLIKILSLLMNSVKLAPFAWYSVKIRVIFGVRLERRKSDKKQTYMKTETCKLYSRVFWILLPNIIKIDPHDFELYRFKVWSFFLRHSAILAYSSSSVRLSETLRYYVKMAKYIINVLPPSGSPISLVFQN